MLHRSCIVLAALLFVAVAGQRAAADSRLEPFFGTYVGSADSVDMRSGETEQRDMDVVVSSHKNGGFKIHWTNVTRVNGRRDVPGVIRRVADAVFEKAEGHDYFVGVSDYSPFRTREAAELMSGDPLRWAVVDDEGMHLYNFVVLDDGRYEMQVYDRSLSDIGMDITYQRFVDGELRRLITGRTVRIDD